MPLIVAIESDRKQAAHLAALAKGPLRAEWILAETTARALAALGDRVPDLILTSALLPPKDEAALAERLRALDAAASHVQTLTIPVFASPSRRARKDTTSVLSRLTRSRTPVKAAPEGCDPGVFAAQVAEYLERAADDRRRAELERTAVASAEEDPAIAPPDFAFEPAPANEIVSVDQEAAGEPGFKAGLEPRSTFVDVAQSFRPAAIAETGDIPALAFAEPAFVESALAEPASVESAFVESASAEPAFAATAFAAPVEIPAPVQIVEPPAAAASESVEPVEVVEAAAATELAAVEPVEAVPEPEPMAVIAAEEPPDVPAWPPAIAFERQAPMLISVGDLDLRAFLAELEAATAGVEADPAADQPMEPVAEPVETVPATAAGRLDDEEAPVRMTLDSSREVAPDFIAEVARDVSPANNDEESVEDASIVEEPPPMPRMRDAIDINASELWMALPGACHRWWPPLEGVAAEDAPLAAPFVAVSRPAAPVIVVEEQPAAAPIDSAPPPARRKKRKKAAAAVQDEWGFFDPAQCGFAALVAKLDEIADPDDEPPARRPA